jgi:hypothetical protein
MDRESLQNRLQKQKRIQEVREIFGGEVVSQDKLDASREQFYSKKFDPDWLYRKKYGNNKAGIRQNKEMKNFVYDLSPYKEKLTSVGRGRKDIKGKAAWQAYAKAAETDKYYADDIGIKAEAAYCWHTGQKLDKRHMKHGDEGYDTPDGADVKGTKHTTTPIRLMVKQDQYLDKVPKIYVLGVVTGWKVYLVGWISRDEFDKIKREEKGRPNPAAKTELGRSGVNWVVDKDNLHPMWEKGPFPGV